MGANKYQIREERLKNILIRMGKKNIVSYIVILLVYWVSYQLGNLSILSTPQFTLMTTYIICIVFKVGMY